MVVEKNKIKFVGSLAEAQKIPVTRTVDLKNNVVLPGFHDTHMHPLEASNPAAGTCKLPKNTWPNHVNISKVFTQEHCHLNQKGTKW